MIKQLFKNHLNTTKKQILFLVFLAFIPRLYRITNPVADWHAFRQADTASVTREYVKNGIDILHPHYHDLSNIQSGQDNLEGFRMVEFPFINVLIAGILRLVPILPLVATSRIFSVFASLGTLVFLYKFVYLSTKDINLAFLSGLFFALIPYSIYYSRVILPEPFFLFFSMGSIFFLSKAVKNKNKFYKNKSFWISAVFLSASFLLKPFVAFLAPLYLLIILQNIGWKKLFHWSWIIYAVISLLPFLLWRDWILQFPSGIPASDWLFNSNLIRFRPAWFRWLFYERFTKLILGYTGIILATVGLFNNKYKTKKSFKNILWAWGFGLLAYLSIIATGNVQHDYYQVIFVPFFSILLGVGLQTLWKKTTTLKNNLQKLAQIFIILITVSSLLLAWKNVSGYFNVNHWEYVETGERIDKLLPKDAKVIATAFGDTIFLFQTNRTGWPIGFEIEDKIEKGAQYYISTSYDDEARNLEKTYTTIEKTSDYIIIDLTKKEIIEE
ncbi:MAG: phospholipid carrier-dependent glycosyltransferase [Candidatus Pacebacteria bacterium]|jgi:dolichyl-phosphate-mannose--protein O-mannosyl transferase|nr:phospholipid carrier-dependent glycosyltransferase [Candidatus Paceibacterota bacterium]MBT4652069.1 phospholipid carrier-dependent glycosyltransferase [Candidatus Paceibacterota bacterium]MBT6756091.1 phospholipid carrier-dependent glycosyltransferase [Candidatus Paceibacterota bacterium]MBT6921684.1 phospholipid carrier-dependent glycosyltransferase [Candidatus Paceibacterota bacterium]